MATTTEHPHKHTGTVLKKVAAWLLLVTGLFLFFVCPMVYWVRNPELTQMQVLMEYWIELLCGTVLIAVGGFVVGIHENQ